MALVKAGLLTVLVNCAYLAPFLYFYYKKATRVSNIFKSDYVKETIEFRELFIKGSTVNAAGLLNPVLGFSGAACLMIIIFGFLIYKNAEKDSKHEFMISLFWLMILFLISSTSLMPYKQLSKVEIVDMVMPTLQFPYRFTSIVTVLCALLVGYVIDSLRIKTDKKIFLTVGVFIIMLICAFEIADSTVESGGFARMQSLDERYIDYIPEGADNDKLSSELLKKADSEIVIENYVKNGNKISFDYKSLGETLVDLPLYFYPGYIARTSDGKQLMVCSGENMRVRVALLASETKKTVNVFYSESLLFRVSKLVTLFTLLVCAAYFFGISSHGVRLKYHRTK